MIPVTGIRYVPSMNLLKSFSIYTFAAFFNRGINFLLAPVLTYFLTEEDMGTLALLNSYLIITASFSGIGFKGAVSVRYFQIAKDDFRTYFSSGILGPVFLFGLILLAAILFQNPLSAFLEIKPFWVILIAFLAFSQVLTDLCQTLFRIEDRPTEFAVFSIGMALLNTAVTLALITGFGLNWQGRVWGWAAGYGIFALIALLVFFRKDLLFNAFKKNQLRNALLFGIPLIPHYLGTFVVEYSDRFFLEEMVGRKELGIYDQGYKIGMSMQLLVMAFSMTYNPFLFDSLKNITEHLRKRIVRISYFFLLGMSLAVLLLFLFSPIIFLIFDEKFYEGHQYVGWVALGYLFYGCYAVIAGFIHYTGKTYIFTILAIFNVGVNLILNYYLIGAYGPIGAAYATIISYALLFIITFVIANRLNPMPWFSREIWDWKAIKAMVEGSNFFKTKK